MTDCIFCKIIAKQIPSTVVYEDDAVYAFLDINPVHPGHTLVVPKEHSSGYHDARPEALSKLALAVQKVAKAVQVATGAGGYNIQQNNGAVAGQVVPHLHVHIIPRHADDGLRHWPHGAYASMEEAQGIAEKIKSIIE